MTILGHIPRNEEIPTLPFCVVVPGTSFVGIHLNQYSPDQLSNSIPYFASKAGQLVAKGMTPVWSVPLPGKGNLDATNVGVFDGIWYRVGRNMAAVQPIGPLYARIAWEFGFEWQENAARHGGQWNPALYARAFRRIVGGIRAGANGRQVIILWSPAIGDQGFDPLLAYPGDEWVDWVTPDFYMGASFGNKPGDFNYFRDHAFGLKHVFDFAAAHKKPIGFAELGFQGDEYLADATATFDLLASYSVPTKLVLIWDRPEVIDTTVSNGSKPALTALYAARAG